MSMQRTSALNLFFSSFVSSDGCLSAGVTGGWLFGAVADDAVDGNDGSEFAEAVDDDFCRFQLEKTINMNIICVIELRTRKATKYSKIM
jgi:hypothetical protein